MEVSTYKSLVEHLQSKEFPDIDNKILNGNKLTKSNKSKKSKKSKFKSAVPYILNKLNNLYNINDVNDVKQITPESLTGIHENNKFEQMVFDTDTFKKDKLVDMVDSIIENNNINWCLMHGIHTDTIFKVPNNAIIVLMAPTNRVLLQNINNYTSFVKLVNDNDFVKKYLKNPDCLSTQNYCFKYTTILYPGQLCFELMLKGPREGDIMSKKMSFFGNLKTHADSLYEYITNNETPGVYFIYSCRGCNLSIPHKLVEVLYYNEYVCNYINKNKTICNLKNNVNKSEILCKTDMFAKFILPINNNVPKLNFTPINNNNKNTDIIDNIILTLLSYKTDTDIKTVEFIDLFEGFIQLGERKNFIKSITSIDVKLNKNHDINDICTELFSKRLAHKWISFIAKYFFDKDNTLIYAEDICNIFESLNKENYTTPNILQKCILGQFILYYFYTNNSDCKTNIQTLLTNIFKNIQFNDFIKISKYSIHYTYGLDMIIYITKRVCPKC